jgi:hypothetical protein
MKSENILGSLPSPGKLKTFYDTKGKCYGSTADYLKINEKYKYPRVFPQPRQNVFMIPRGAAVAKW